jgi:hypothetical protein
LEKRVAARVTELLDFGAATAYQKHFRIQKFFTLIFDLSPFFCLNDINPGVGQLLTQEIGGGRTADTAAHNGDAWHRRLHLYGAACSNQEAEQQKQRHRNLGTAKVKYKVSVGTGNFYVNLSNFILTMT